MRIATKEFLKQNTDHAARPSVQITVRRYMPKNRRYTVSAWSGWPMDSRKHYGGWMGKTEAVALANKLAAQYL